MTRLSVELPHALAALPELCARLTRDRATLFLDYDGTLTPIVSRPHHAVLEPPVRHAIERLAGCVTVAIVTGRDVDTIRELVGLEGIYYAANHGFDIVTPDGTHRPNPQAEAAGGAVADAEQALRRTLAQVPGVEFERKRYSLAVHYRNVPEAQHARVGTAVRAVAQAHPGLRLLEGKCVLELLPDLPYDKGQAVLAMLRALGRNRGDALFIGDDLTDEDAFRVLADEGIGIVVADRPRPTAARYQLASQAQVAPLLVGLHACLCQPEPAAGAGDSQAPGQHP